MALIELGLVDGNYFADEHVDAIEAAINTACHAGDIKMSIADVAPAGWLLLAGQVVPNAQTLYPDLWTVAPAAWKAGTNLTLPNATQRIPYGGPVGTVGGTTDVAIAQANLPAATITIDPPNTGLTGNTGTESATHVHPRGNNFSAGSDQGVDSDINLYDPLPVSTGAANTGTESATHTHPAGTLTVDIAPFQSGPLGAGTALTLPAPPWFAVNFMIKAH